MHLASKNRLVDSISAERVWEIYSPPGNFVVDPFAIAKAMYPELVIEMVDQKDLGEEVAAFTGLENDNYVIKLDKTMGNLRLRFAMAFCLGRIFCKTKLPAYDTNNSYSRHQLDSDKHAASNFAKGLLLPKALVLPTYEVISAGNVGITGLAKMFEVSEVAMAVRLQDLKILPYREFSGASRSTYRISADKNDDASIGAGLKDVAKIVLTLIS